MSTYSVKLKYVYFCRRKGCHVDEKYTNRIIGGKVAIDSNFSGSSIVDFVSLENAG